VVVKTLCEDGVGWIVIGKGVRFVATRAVEAEQISHDVSRPFDVLRRKAMVVLEEQGRELACYHEMGFVSRRLRGELRRSEEPANRGRVVAKGEDTLMRILAGFALEPHVDDHPEKFKEVIDFGASKNGACRGDPNAPGPAVEAVTANAERAGVGPADAGWIPDDDQVHGYASSHFLKEAFPELEILEFVASKCDECFSEGVAIDVLSDAAQEMPGHRHDGSRVVEMTDESVKVILGATVPANAVTDIL
jgi:hypothetical protein